MTQAGGPTAPPAPMRRGRPAAGVRVRRVRALAVRKAPRRTPAPRGQIAVIRTLRRAIDPFPVSVPVLMRGLRTIPLGVWEEGGEADRRHTKRRCDRPRARRAAADHRHPAEGVKTTTRPRRSPRRNGQKKHRGEQARGGACSPRAVALVPAASDARQPTPLNKTESPGDEGQHRADAGRVNLGDGRGGQS